MKHAFNLPLITGLLMLAASGSATAVSVPGQGTWQTTLQARDIDHDGLVDAYYDSVAKVTWLADANLIQTSHYTPGDPLNPQPNGEASWFTADVWSSSLNVGGVTGWRLPSLVNQNVCDVLGAHGSCQPGVQEGSSELENLIETTLGNTNGLTNTGPFQNLQAGFYWIGTQTTAWPGSSVPYWVYNTISGNHSADHSQDFGTYAFVWALHDGDIGTAITPAVPEPSTYAMLVCGLALTYSVRRRAVKQPG